jgi:predicted HNH restriction endonuclease
MRVPSVQEYKEAIENVLIPRQITMLQILYQFPNATATAKELALQIHPANPAPIMASGRVGRTGKRIADYCGIVPENYFDGRIERPAYFTLISEIYERNVGWTMRPNLQRALEELKLVGGQAVEVSERLPTETLPFEDQKLFREGKVVQVFVNRYERNQSARIKCIAHYGHKCQVCGIDFGETYGDIADGFIHVHHKTQLADIGDEYEVDPINDLVPLCANCHSVVHLTKPALTIEEIKKLTKKSSR